MIAELKDWFGLISLVISVGIVLWGWLTAGDKKAVKDLSTKVSDLAEAVVSKTEIADLKAKILNLTETDKRQDERANRHDQRIQSLESDMKHLPDREQSHRLELAIEKLTGRVETLDERMAGRLDTLDEKIKPLAASYARVNNYVLEMAGER